MERFEEVANSYCRDGIAKTRGMRNQCKKKLCIFSTDRELIFDLLYEGSQANDCFEVKVLKADRLGVYVGQYSFTNESSLGDAWARYESHPKLWAVIQDDIFFESYKSKIKNYLL